MTTLSPEIRSRRTSSPISRVKGFGIRTPLSIRRAILSKHAGLKSTIFLLGPPYHFPMTKSKAKWGKRGSFTHPMLTLIHPHFVRLPPDIPALQVVGVNVRLGYVSGRVVKERNYEGLLRDFHAHLPGRLLLPGF